MDFMLVPFTKNDFELIYSSITSKSELIKWAGSRLFTYPLNEGQMLHYLSRIEGDLPEAFIYKFIRIEDGEDIGIAEISDIDWDNMSAVLSRVMVFPKFRNKGYSHYLIKAILDTAFSIMNFREMRLFVFTINAPAIKCYKVAGFECIQINESACVVDDIKWDSILMYINYTRYFENING